MWEVNTPKKKKIIRWLKMRVVPGNDSVANRPHGEGAIFEAERFEFEPGPDFTLDAFLKYVDDLELST